MILLQFFIAPNEVLWRPLFKQCLSILKNGGVRHEREVSHTSSQFLIVYKTTCSFVSDVSVYLYTHHPTVSDVNMRKNMTIELIECDLKEWKAI